LKGYQKKVTPVKWGAPAHRNIDEVKEEKENYTIKVIDAERLMEAAEEGLMSLFYKVGLEAMYQILEQDVIELVGPKGKHDKNRQAYRHGKEKSKVTLDDQKISIDKPRVRSNGHDIPLPSFPYFQNEDALNRSIFTRMICGASTRKYGRTVTMEDDGGVCTSKSEVSRRFKTELKKLMEEFFDRRLDDDFPLIMLDGMETGGMTVIVAIGIKNDGKKQVLGLVEGATENSDAVKMLLADLIKRGLSTDTPRLFTIDGSKALKKAVNDTFGQKGLIQRCQVHKKRNVLSHLPQSEQATIGLAVSRAYLEFDFDKALHQMNLIADNLEYRYPDAAASLKEGLEETLTVHRLNLPGLLRKTLSSTNAIESANSVAAGIVRKTSKWRDGEMILRHMAAGFLEAERGFRRIQGYRQIPILKNALFTAAGGVSGNAVYGEAL